MKPAIEKEVVDLDTAFTDARDQISRVMNDRLGCVYERPKVKTESAAIEQFLALRLAVAQNIVACLEHTNSTVELAIKVGGFASVIIPKRSQEYKPVADPLSGATEFYLGLADDFSRLSETCNIPSDLREHFGEAKEKFLKIIGSEEIYVSDKDVAFPGSDTYPSDEELREGSVEVMRGYLGVYNLLSERCKIEQNIYAMLETFSLGLSDKDREAIFAENRKFFVDSMDTTNSRAPYRYPRTQYFYRKALVELLAPSNDA